MKCTHPYSMLLVGSLSACAPALASADLLFSEYVEGSSNNKALEIFNGQDTAVDLAPYEVQMHFNGNTTPGLTINLAGSIAPGDVFVLAHGSAAAEILAVADQLNSASWFNGDDAITLLKGGVVIDRIGQIGLDPGTEWGTGVTSTADNTLRRLSAQTTGSTDAYDVFDPALEWEGFAVNSFDGLGFHLSDDGETPCEPGQERNDAGQCVPVPTPAQCGQPSTLISAIQGAAATSPLVGQIHSIEAVVVGDFQGEDHLKGFFLQEELSDQDDNPLTSEGLFLYDGGTGIEVRNGDVLRATGRVSEFGGMTQLSSLTHLEICQTQASVPATPLTLPVADLDQLEALEGMAVILPQTLSVTETYNLGRYGEVVLSNGRLFIPTNLVAPGEEATLVQAENDRNRIILDDGSTRQNPTVVPYPAPGLSADNTLRSGDQVTAVVGVLQEAFDAYRIQPTGTPEFLPANPRPLQPELPGIGNLRIASFNVLNYFNGDGLGGGFPTARGANTPEEFERQRGKIISAISAMDAGIVGLMEIENDGYGEQSAIQDLIHGLNGVGGNYAPINPGLDRLGSDAITVGLIYDAQTVEPIGPAVTLDSYPFDTKNRQPLAQTFRLLENGEKLTVVVNHFKSKGCGNDATGGNLDLGDGQGCWNQMRTEAAQALNNWLASDPTGQGESRILIMGDLNAYAKEDPIAALQAAGYTNLIAKLHGDTGYSYVFQGQSGYLDHALATAALSELVTGVTEWHINADEPRILDYNVEFKTGEQVTGLYSPDAFRSSDHDPVIIEVNLQATAQDLEGDFNGDGNVDFRDFRMLLKQLFKPVTDANREYDLNQDGKINLGDLLEFLRR